MDEELTQSEQAISNSSGEESAKPDSIEQTTTDSISNNPSADDPVSTEPSADVPASAELSADIPVSSESSADDPVSIIPASTGADLSNATMSAPVTPASASDRLEYAPMRSAFPTDTNAHRSGDTSQNTTEFHMSPSTTANYDYSEPEEFSTGYAIASLVLGILSLFGSCCCCIPGTLFSVLGIVFGCIQPKDSMDQKPGMAIAGIVLSCIGLVISLCSLIYLAVTTFLVN